jgi:hypothetical protein
MRNGMWRRPIWTESAKTDALLWVVAGVLLTASAITIGSCQRLSPIGMLSEEPPIRVKNGSQDLEITGDTWQRDGDDKNWKPTKYDRSKDDLDVVVSYDQGAKCNKGGMAYGRVVDIEYKDKNGALVNNVNVTAPGKKLKVKSKNDLKHNGAYTVISYGEPKEGWISRVLVDNVELCTFDSANALNVILILDYPPTPRN